MQWLISLKSKQNKTIVAFNIFHYEFIVFSGHYQNNKAKIKNKHIEWIFTHVFKAIFSNREIKTTKLKKKTQRSICVKVDWIHTSTLSPVSVYSKFCGESHLLNKQNVQTNILSTMERRWWKQKKSTTTTTSHLQNK